MDDLENLSLTDAYAKTAAVFWGPAPVWTFEGIGLTPTDWSDFPLAGPVFPQKEVKGIGRDSNKNADTVVRPDGLVNAVREKQGTGLLLGCETRPGVCSVGKDANPNVRDRTVSTGAVCRPPRVRVPHNGSVRKQVETASAKTHGAYASLQGRSKRNYEYSSAKRKWFLAGTQS
jgi:hypothetical protein